MSGDVSTSSGSGSNQGGGFFDLQLSDLFGAGVELYDRDRERARVGSGGPTPTTQPNSPAPATVGRPDYGLDLPPWAKTLLIVSGCLLAGAVAWKLVK